MAEKVSDFSDVAANVYLHVEKGHSQAVWAQKYVASA